MLRIMLKMDRVCATDEVYRDSEVFIVRRLYLRRSLIFCYQKRTGIAHPNHIHDTRCRDAISYKNRMAMRIGQRHYNYLICKMYDILPKDLLSNKSLRSFTKELSKWLIDVSVVEMRKVFNWRIRDV
ncbi:hypothetical protein WA026_022396 [Henosepilachna vigintioctopunctata]|uniref:Uncharacterized protein n=1 Tax=Henosepilachna vigintioctopunctata TaxID=420089 RepID=A0AAW1U423_9CUCU